ncbi:DUF6502 family protein [Hydrogenophaga sp. A37]|uniref:DUF6502 family protein n=1 Tax=Hydrogenophaga sp. A37 TaxID=1945864 RepID=UPI0009846928|nr:DUF6502 family protein [Hydrogenophaga sp. A37]OOG82333.1 hypothetical protein B0E41_15790 [Hydrogenophaga sp. A37]
MSSPSEPSPTLRGAAPGGPSPALVRALRKLLRPLVKLMLSQGITYPYLSDLLKGLFVEVAEQDFRLDGKPPTDSRVSLVSGVHRKDVSRLRSLLDSAEHIKTAVVPRGAQLVAHWMSHPRYLMDGGQPRPLARLISEGGDLSFEALVSSVNSDIRSRVVLDEWLNLGLVHLDDKGLVRLNTGAFVPSRAADERAFYLGHNLHAHAAAAVHNMLAGQPPFMERSVHHNSLSPASVERLNKLAEQMGMKVLLAIDQAAMEAEAQDAAAAAQAGLPAPDQRFTLGLYVYTERFHEPRAKEPGAA